MWADVAANIDFSTLELFKFTLNIKNLLLENVISTCNDAFDTVP